MRQNKKLLFALKHKLSDEVLRSLANGAQADGKDKNGHAFVVHANSAYRYDANAPRVWPECQDMHYDGNQHDVYRILCSQTSLVKPRIIDVGGSRFYVHDPSPTLTPDDLGVLPTLIDGDKNFGESELIFDPEVFIDRDPKVFSTILDFYHMGEHMQWTQEVTDNVELLKSLCREAVFYNMPKLITNTAEKIKNHPTYVLLQTAKSLVPFGLRLTEKT